MPKVIVDNVYSKIAGNLPKSLNEEICHKLSYFVQGYHHMKAFKENRWDGKVRLYNTNSGQTFYTGLLSIVRQIFKKHEVDFEIIDRRVRPEINYPELKFTPPDFYFSRDYQDFTIQRALKFTRGVLCMCTGAGKTIVATRLISELQVYPFIFYVLTTDLMQQAHDVLSSCLNQKIGMIGDGQCDIQKISICTQQTALMALKWDDPKFDLKDYYYDEEDRRKERPLEESDKRNKIKKLIKMARGIYFDECHHVSSSTCVEVLKASPNAYWRYGGSATPFRDSGDEIMIQAMFGNKIVDINASYLIKKDVLVRPRIIFEHVDSKVKKVHSYAKIYKVCVSENDKFNNHVVKTALFLEEKGLSVMVLVRLIKHGNWLEKKIPNSVFLKGEHKREFRKKTLDKLRNGEIKVLIATSLADEGLDVPTLDCAILAGGGKSSTRIFQRIGRTIRKDKEGRKKQSLVIIYEHNAKYLNAHAKKIRNILKREPEFSFINCNGEDFIFDDINKVLGEKSESGGSLFV